MAPPLPPLTSNALLTTFTDFLLIATHTILYERSIYPRESFLSASAYNYPVRQSRHPGLCRWITDAVASIRHEMTLGRVARVALVLVSPQDNQPLERYMFDVGRFPVVSLADADIPMRVPRSSSAKEREIDSDDGAAPPLADDGDDGDDAAPQKLSADLVEQLRALIARIALSAARLAPLPADCTFTLAVELRDGVEPPVGHPQPWIPVGPSLQTRGSTSQRRGSSGRSTSSGVADNSKEGTAAEGVVKGADVGGVRTTAVRAVDTDEVQFEMWIEESKAKVDMVASGASPDLSKS